jgi:phenylacetic acid degradation operon negative regulatory protein
MMGRMAHRPRGLILDLFGDYLRYVDAEVRLSHLTTLLDAFDVGAPTVRVTLSRLRREGWFETERLGREMLYRMTPGMLDVLDEGRERIFAAPVTEWSGSWTMVIYQLSESERQERHELRKALAWHGFGPLTTSTWMAPGDRRKEARTFVDTLTDERVDILACTSEGLDHDRDLARRCWDLDALAEEYGEFVRSNRQLVKDAARLAGAKALVARTQIIRTYRHFPFRDPRLPAELRPEPWPGGEAYRLFRTVHTALGPAARRYVADVIGRELPEPDLPTT